MIDALSSYKRERAREVVEELIAGLEHVSNALVTDKARSDFERFASALLLPTAKRLGWDPRKRDSEDDKLLRRSVLTALATLTDDKWMAREAEKRALAFLADTDSVDADAAAIALRVTARRRHKKVGFAQLSAALKQARSPGDRIALVQALASLGDPKELERALALMLDGSIRTGDAVYVMRAAIAWPDSRTVFIDWLQRNLEALAEQSSGFGAGRMVGAVLLSMLVAASACTVAIPPPGSAAEQRVIQQGTEYDKVITALGGKQPKKVIVVPGRMINVVV